MKGVPRIQEFPCDNRYWQVDWFGAVEPNPTIPREPTIQVIISPFATTTIQNLPASKLASASSSVITYSEQKTISIGTGQLPTLCIGSIWRNGKLQ